MFCSKCGMKNKSESKFCMSCGNSLQTNLSQPNKSSFTENIQATPKLGETPDFYTKLSAVLVLLVFIFSYFAKFIAFITAVGAIITAVFGRKKTTNRSLHNLVIIGAILSLLYVLYVIVAY